MNNATIQRGVDAFNEAQQNAVEAKVVAFIRSINSEKSQIKTYEDNIELLRKEAQAVIDDVITDVSVMGSRVEVAGNPNAQTFVNAIAKINATRQANVTAQTERITARITELQNNIKACNKRIAEVQVEAAKLAAATVTVTDVMGN